VREPRTSVEVVDGARTARRQRRRADPDERLGVALVDIGGGTTDFAVFERGGFWHTRRLAVGGDHFTTTSRWASACRFRTPRSSSAAPAAR
jgi:ethanolamine utilization protein EutA (predicted chaperonin)